MTFVATSAVTLSVVAAMNFVVNPVGDSPVHALPLLITDARDTKLELLARAAPRTRVLILGSSRAMKISPVVIEEITGMRAFNASVESAMTEDYYAMLRYAVEQQHAPLRLVLLGVDVEAFHNHRPLNERLTASRALHGYVTTWNAAPWRAFTRLFTVTPTYYSLLSIDQRLRHKRHRIGVVYDANGLLHYPNWERTNASGQSVRAPEKNDFNETIVRSIDQYRGRFENYTSPSRTRIEFMKRTVEYCRARGIRLKVFVTPLHPVVIRAIDPQGFEERRREVLTLLRELTGGPVLDFTEPASFDGDLRDFYDGAHIAEENAARIVRRLVSASDAVQ